VGAKLMLVIIHCGKECVGYDPATTITMERFMSGDSIKSSPFLIKFSKGENI